MRRRGQELLFRPPQSTVVVEKDAFCGPNAQQGAVLYSYQAFFAPAEGVLSDDDLSELVRDRCTAGPGQGSVNEFRQPVRQRGCVLRTGINPIVISPSGA
jgi:hypothetical protein